MAHTNKLFLIVKGVLIYVFKLHVYIEFFQTNLSRGRILYMQRKDLGFTLIELLVVVAIISLLSSVILASVKDARQKAQDSAVRQSISQLINALELYRSDYGTYPAVFLGTTYSDGKSKEIQGPGDPAFLKYIGYFPKSTPSVSYIIYGPGSYGYGCEGDSTPPPYVIYVPGTSVVFKDWRNLVTSYNPFTVNTDNKCFSLR